MPKRPVSKAKAREILEHGSVRGHKLSKKQRGLFGAIAGGSPLRKYHKSPDTYNDMALGEVPARSAYKGTPDNVNTRESAKRAGATPGAVQQNAGTENRRADYRTKSATRAEAGSGRTRWGGVDSYQDTKEL